MYVIDDDLKRFVESGVHAVVGTADRHGRPAILSGWGTRVREDCVSMDVFVDTARADHALANLRETGRIAVVLGDPLSYRSVQFKGPFLDCGEPSAADCAWVQRQRDAFMVAGVLVGDLPTTLRNLFMDDLTRITFAVASAFNQTPGPEAGKPL